MINASKVVFFLSSGVSDIFTFSPKRTNSEYLNSIIQREEKFSRERVYISWTSTSPFSGPSTSKFPQEI